MRIISVLFAVLFCLSSACSTGESLPEQETQELVVFAAASLREAFTELALAFKVPYPASRVRFNFAGSQELRVQLEHGARADVFASADVPHMRALEQAGFAEQAVLFARNEPVLVVAQESAPKIREFAQLPDAERIVLGAKEVPIGRYTQQILDRANALWGKEFRQRVEAKLVSRELNVRQVLTKVRLGEAQAGIVYLSDVKASSDVQIVRIPEFVNVVAEYPIARLRGAPRPELAQAFIDFVRGESGQAVLRRAGFLAGTEER